MESVNCNLCGSDDLSIAYRAPDVHYHPDEWFTINRCGRCGLGFVSPRPSPSEMGGYYPTAFYHEFDTDLAYHKRRYDIEASFIERFATTEQPRRLLDIGCANGDFPRVMRARGWDVEGVEVSRSSTPIGDFPVYTRPFHEIPLSSATFDAVSAWAVLEHVHNPMVYFEKAAQVLKPRGVFVFLVTNFDSLASRHLYREDVPRHLYFFTEPTVRQYLHRTGFELLAVDYTDNIYSMLPVGWLRYFVSRRLGRHYGWRDSRKTHDVWLRDRGLPRTAKNLAHFAATHPLSVIDRVTAPLRARWEMRHHQYGIVTYFARRV